MTGRDPPRAGDGSPTERHATATDRWLGEGQVLDAPLPADLRSALGRFLGGTDVETLGEWAAAVRDHTGGGPMDLEELCVTDEETPHWGTVDGDRYHFACFYDAVILAATTDRPVDVRTESPSGEVVRARAAGGDDLTVTPADAAFSFGIDEDVTPPAGDSPSLESGYAAICPYVRAFPNAAAFERWADRAPAPTVGMPLAGATDLAVALATGDED